LTLQKKTGAENDTLQLIADMAGGNINVTWDSSTSNEWTTGGQEWADQSLNSTQFMSGDSVTFGSGTTDLKVAALGVEVSAMVIEAGNHSFSGGAIISTNQIEGNAVDPTEKLEVKGPAVATFSNQLDFKNGLEIDSGAKVTLAGQAALADTMAIANDGELVFNTDNDYQQKTVISGNGLLTKDGSSHLTLTAQNTFSGNTNVNDGLLTLAQTAALAGDVRVTSGGLEVRGTIEGSVTIAPDANAYLMAGAGGIIEGDLTMGNNSFLEIANENSLLTVRGATTLGSINARLHGLDGWQEQNYLVLEVADENELASFPDQSVTTYALIDYTLTKSGNKLVLAVSSVSTPTEVAITYNQKAVAGALASLKSGALKTFVDTTFINMTEDKFLEALDQLSAPVIAQVLEVASGFSHNFSQTVISHLADKYWVNSNSGQNYSGSLTAPSAGSFSGPGHNLWFSAGGSYARYGGENNVSATIVRGYDLRLGYDLSLDNGFLAGAVLGFDNQRIGMDRPYAQVDLDTFSAALYGGAQFEAGPGTLRLILGASYSSHAIDSERRVIIDTFDGILKANYHGQTWQIFGEAAFNFELSQKVSLEPYLNLTWQSTSLSSFKETGPLVSLTTKKSTVENFITNLGLRVKAQLSDKVSLSGSLGWQHKFGSVRPKTTMAFRDSGDYFTVQGSPTNRDSVTAELSLKVNLTDSLAIQANYDGAFGRKSQRHAGSAVFSFTW
jgi:autotransporter-associated beta strand protein